MKATIVKDHKCKFTTSHRKEGKCFFNSMVIVSLADKPWGDGRIDPKISLRLYGTGNKNFACLWVSMPEGHWNGSDSAGGYGYHRPSQAAEGAIRNAGFKLDKAIGGVGEEAMREALFAIAKAVGVKRPALIESYP
jgi:hypothetical protein